jgi:hypothetical protein
MKLYYTVLSENEISEKSVLIKRTEDKKKSKVSPIQSLAGDVTI